MATFKEVLLKALERDDVRLASINQNIMAASRETKRKPHNITVAVSEATINNHLTHGNPKEAGFLLHIDGDVLDAISRELDGKGHSDDHAQN